MKTVEELVIEAPEGFQQWLADFYREAVACGFTVSVYQYDRYPQVYLVVSLVVDGVSLGGFMFETVPVSYRPNVWNGWQKNATSLEHRMNRLAIMSPARLAEEVANAKLLREYRND